MKTYKHYLLGVAVTGVLAVGTSACNRELLTPIPQTSVADVSAFSTVNRIQTQLLSLYGGSSITAGGGLKDGNFYGGRYVIYGDIRGEDFINELSNLVTGSDVWNLNPTNSTTAVQNLWQSAYSTINKCNIFLEGMAAGGTAVVGDALGNQYIAEAKLIRGLSYYSLLQYYARPYADGNGANPGVPLRLTGIKGTGQSSIARSSVSDVYAQVLKDLNEAESGLPSTYTVTVAGENTTRAHKNTAIALKTRVYLSMQRYADVVTEANKIVNSTAPFRATSGVANQLLSDVTTIYGTAANSELIFALPMTTTAGDFPGTQNQLAYYYSPIGSNGGVGNGEYSLNPRGIIAESSWTSTDKRRSFIRQSGTGTSAKSWLIKYKQPTPYTDWVPVIRYAEVLLNLAEARVRTTNSVDAQAVALLNAVRNRSDAATTFTTASFASSTALTNAILLERRIEFLGEGLRNNDLMRLLQTIPAKGSVPAKAPTEPGYIWPISASELALNNLITDN